MSRTDVRVSSVVNNRCCEGDIVRRALTPALLVAGG